MMIADKYAKYAKYADKRRGKDGCGNGRYDR